MAKKNKKNDAALETPAVNTENTTPVSEIAPEVASVDPTSEVEAVEVEMEVVAEDTAEAVEPTADIDSVEVDVTVEAVEPVAVEEIKSKSQKEMFEEAISKIPFLIYQNGIMVCHSNPHLVIKTEAKYFEINFKKYSYTGIEVKHK